jgi:hypothetical protein
MRAAMSKLRMRLLQPVLTLLFLGIASASASAADEKRGVKAQPLPRAASEATINEKIQRLTRPTTTRELLVNLKIGLEQGFFASSEFYAAENLTFFFGSSELRWHLDTPVNKTVFLGLDYLPLSERPRAGVVVSRSLNDPGDLRRSDVLIYSSFSISCKCQLRLEDVDAVFGNFQKTIAAEQPIKSSPRSMHVFPALPKPTDSMGNKRATYDIPTPPRYSSSLVVVLDPAGNIKLIVGKQSEGL